MLSENFDDSAGAAPSRLDSESAMSGVLLTSPMAAVASAPSAADCQCPGPVGRRRRHGRLALSLLGRAQLGM